MVVAFHLLATYRLGVGEAHMVPRPFGNAEMGSIDTGFASRLVVGFGYGVEVFFGISGFILALPFIAERFAEGPRRSIRAYYLRRVTRLEPPYLVALGLASVLALLVGTDPGVVRSRFLISSVYANGSVFGHANPISSVLWSLEIEVFFYLSAPWLARLFAVFSDAWMRRVVIASVAVASLLISTMVGVGPFRGVAEFLLYLPFFLGGWLVADLWVVSWRTPPTHPRRWDAAAVCGLVGCLLLFMQPYWMVVMVGPLAVGLLLAGALRGPGARSVSRNRIFATIGGMCYSIYLMHYPTMVLIAPIFTRRTGWVVTCALAAIDLVVVVGVCLTFYLLVERPCMDPTWPGRLNRAARKILRRAPSDPVLVPTPVGVDA